MTGDAELVSRCRAGAEGAWEDLVAHYSRYVYAIAARAYRLAPHDAEDVFQDVFLRVYDRLDSLRDETALRPWIAQLTRNACHDRLRTASRAEAELVEPPAVGDELTLVDEALDVHEALELLGDPCREILDRFFARDESYRTIGEALGIPAGTIASRISRCLSKLRDELEGRNPRLGESGRRR